MAANHLSGPNTLENSAAQTEGLGGVNPLHQRTLHRSCSPISQVLLWRLQCGVRPRELELAQMKTCVNKEGMSGPASPQSLTLSRSAMGVSL